MNFRVSLSPSGHSFEVAEQEPILQAGLTAGISLPYGCRMGTCTTCRGKVVSGRVDLGHVHPSYLTEADREQGYALLCQAKPLSDVVVEVEELPRLVPPEKFPAMVRRITKLTPDVAIVDLRLPLHLNLHFAAGQYVDVLLPDGARRSYSIASAPKTAGTIDLQIHVRHMPGGVFTDRVFTTLKERDKLSCEGPLGTFFLRDDSDKPVVLLATGTGYGPIRSLILDAFQRKITRPMTFYWGARTKRDLYLLEEPLQWAQAHDNFRFVPLLTRPLPEDSWDGRTGYVQHAAMADFSDLSNYEVYACGSPAMVDSARHEFVSQRGLEARNYHADAFVTQADVAQEIDITEPLVE